MVDEAAALSDDPRVRFGALVHDLGKALTPAGDLPRHPGHEGRGAAPARALAERLRLPAAMAAFGVLAARHHGRVHLACEMGAAAYGRVWDDLGRSTRVADARALATVALADHLGRSPRGGAYPQAGAFVAVVEAMAAARLGDVLAPGRVAGMAPEAVAAAMARARGDAARRAIAARGAAPA